MMTVADRIERFRAILEEWVRGLYHGMITHPAYEKIEKEAEDEFEAWERRLWDRESLIERKGQQYHF